MTAIIKASTIAATIGLALSFSLPAVAAESAACQASWTKMDSKKAGYVMHSDAKNEMAMYTKSGRKTAGADRITDKEYMDACLSDIFTPAK
jgi:hypothetical protein